MRCVDPGTKAGECCACRSGESRFASETARCVEAHVELPIGNSIKRPRNIFTRAIYPRGKKDQRCEDAKHDSSAEQNQATRHEVHERCAGKPAADDPQTTSERNGSN
jgi:hypothetical protein